MSVVALDLDGGQPVPPPAPDRILVGITGKDSHPAAPALDLTLTSADTTDPALVRCDPQIALAEIAAAVEEFPRAALALVALLRAERPVGEALAAEAAAYASLLAGPEHAAWAARRPTDRPPAGRAVLVSGGTVTLARPTRRNAYGRQARDGLVAALRMVPERGPVLLRADGPAFCAGAELGELDAASPEPARLLSAMTPRLSAYVHGACIGPGLELAAFAGTLEAAPGTLFRLPEPGMGLVPGNGGTVSLPRRIGRWRTLHLALSGGSLDAGTAQEWGLTDRTRTNVR